MIHTNAQEKAADAINTNGLHTHTNAVDFRTVDAIQQADHGKTVATLDSLTLIVTTKEPRVSTQQLAEHLGNKHRSLFDLVQRHRTDFEQLGILRFQIGVIEGRGQPEKFAMLNEDQATLALAYSKNTQRVRELKVKLVKAFGLARRAADLRKTEYLPGHHQLHDALHALSAGSSHERHVHMNVNKLLNKFAGVEAGQRASAGLPQQSALTYGQFVAVRAAQGAIDHHDGYQRIKSTLKAIQDVTMLEAT
ncbi:MAG: Rha family transcriptional regulator [Rhodoferax sp.]|uniref:Rha family transcriptional regulator n=1 Tax=Rhodoferax sp. TaxID=50421 RepID=UPI002631C73B|nr:Rha family transcriptional regulator [Rhodoferax sp.]MDD5336157.1 Rha family transcriptional regulator [Rhodoferax sp.]